MYLVFQWCSSADSNRWTIAKVTNRTNRCLGQAQGNGSLRNSSIGSTKSTIRHDVAPDEVWVGLVCPLSKLTLARLEPN